MRAPWLVALTLLVSVPLSGCIDGLLVDGGPEEPTPGPPGQPAWVVLALPTVTERSGPLVLGIWVPDPAWGLRVTWPEDALDDADEPEWDEPDPYPGPGEDLLVVIDPDGTRLFAGRPGLRVTLGQPPGAGPELALLDPDPKPGRHTFVLHGDVPLPDVALKVRPGTPLAPVLPLPHMYDRHILADSWSQPTLLDRGGILTAPRHTVDIRTDILGAGVRGAVLVADHDAQLVAATEVAAATAPGVRDLTFGFDPGGFLREDRFVPGVLDGRNLVFASRLTGPGTALAWIGTSADPGTPHVGAAAAPSFDRTDAGAPHPDAVTLAGTLAPWRAAWFELPAAAHVQPRFEDDDPNRFRIYDAHGDRLVWDTVHHGIGGPYAVPAGRLLIINDGPDRLQLDVIGDPGPDAALHEARTRTTTETLTHDDTVAWHSERLSVYVPGPVVGWDAGRAAGHAADLHVTVQQDNQTLATAPRFHRTPPAGAGCCSLPLFTTLIGDAHWLDGARYGITASSSSAVGTLNLSFTYVDLSNPDPDTPVPGPNPHEA